MNKTIDLNAISGGTMEGKIHIFAWSWETRYSWGHKAEVTADVEGEYNKRLGFAYVRYYNRTWESYRYETVIHIALRSFVSTVTGYDPCKEICKRDSAPMKSAAAETRRLERVALAEGSKELYRRLCDVMDGKANERGYTIPLKVAGGVLKAA